MRRISAFIFLAPVFLLLACKGEQQQEPLAARASPGQVIDVRYGHTVGVGDLLLNFSAVLEESRCAIDAICVWEGNARIVITASRGSVTSALELNTTPPFPTHAVFEGHYIELRELQPYPGAVTTLPRPQAYSATLFVDVQAASAAN